MANYQDVLGNCLPIKNLGTNPILLCYISFFSKYSRCLYDTHWRGGWREGRAGEAISQ